MADLHSQKLLIDTLSIFASCPLMALSLVITTFGLAVSQFRFPCSNNGLCSISDLQLAEDIRDMVTHRFEGQSEALCDLLIALTLRHQCQQFRLPLTELRKCPLWKCRPGRREEAEDPLSDAGAKDSFAACHSQDSSQDLGLVCSLEY